MSDPIDTICLIAGCSREEAEKSYSRTQSIVDSVDELIVFPKTYVKLPAKRKRDLTPEEEKVSKIRLLMEKAEAEIQKNVNASNQRDCEPPSGQIAPHVETAQQNSCFQECQLPSLE